MLAGISYLHTPSLMILYQIPQDFRGDLDSLLLYVDRAGGLHRSGVLHVPARYCLVLELTWPGLIRV